MRSGERPAISSAALPSRHALPREEVARRVGQQPCEMFQTQRLPREEFAAQPPHFAREAFETHLRGVHRGLRHVVQLQGGASSHPSVSAIRSTSHPATAVGVLSAVWATMSATLVSLSCPMPVTTGSGNCATWAQRR